jgi:hypothetical protein
MGYVVVNDDGFAYIDPSSGNVVNQGAVDWWGQSAPGSDRVFLINDSHVDGPGVFLSARDSSGGRIWINNYYTGSCRLDLGDTTGGLALDGGNIYYAANYVAGTASPASPLASAVYAFDAGSGTAVWTQTTTPTSKISAGDGLVYLMENSTTLTARRQSDGTVAWTATINSAGEQAPVLASGLVIVAASDAIRAFDSTTGQLAWTNNTYGCNAPPNTLTFSGGCNGGSLDTESGRNYSTAVPTTTLAVASGSGTIVVTEPSAYQPTLHVLSLATGGELWSGTIDNATGALREPVIVGTTLYVMDSGGLLALQAD